MTNRRKYIRHHIVEMTGLVQNCILCGVTINDYRNCMWSQDQGSPKGYPAGEIYISEGQPTVFTTIEPVDGFADCNE